MANDSTLIELKPTPNPPMFFGALALAVILLSLAWLPFMDAFIESKTPYSFTTGESNVADLIRRSRNVQPDLAIVGSSLCRVLEEGYFDKLAVSNLCVGGGSPLTGLEVLSRSKTVSRMILVEINVLDRPIDAAWSEAASAAASQPRLVSMLSGSGKPLRFLLTKPRLTYETLAQQRQHSQALKASALAATPAAYDNDEAIQAVKANWDNRGDWALATANLARLKDLTNTIASQGSKVYLMYMPFPKALDEHPYAVRTRELAGGSADFTCAACIDVRKAVDVTQLRWRDGAHLDPRSAAVVADGIEMELNSSSKF